MASEPEHAGTAIVVGAALAADTSE